MGGLVALRGAPSLVKSIQRNTITITGATSNTRTIEAVDLNNSRLRLLGRTFTAGSGNGQDSFARLALTNATTVTASVVASPGAESVVVSFEVIEYVPGVIKSVRRDTITTPATTATIPAVNPAKSEVDHLGNTTNSGGANTVATQTTRLALTNGTTVTASAGVDDGQVTGFQVVEWF